MMASGRVVRTVRGPVDPAALGVTSVHEHLWMDSTPLLAVHGYSASDVGPERIGSARYAAHPAQKRVTVKRAGPRALGVA